MPFTGFTSETGEFLWELAFHNEKPWFEAHKEQFLRAVKEPFDALAKETLALMRQKHPDEPYCLHISRIYRDARRLFGRGPYKDHLWFTLWTGEDRHNSPVFWFELSPASFSYGVGFYTATAEQMAALRRYIDANPAEMERLAKRGTTASGSVSAPNTTMAGRSTQASCRRCFWTPTKSSCRCIGCSRDSRRRAAMPPLCKGRWILPQAKDGGIVVFQKLQSPSQLRCQPPLHKGALHFTRKV